MAALLHAEGCVPPAVAPGSVVIVTGPAGRAAASAAGAELAHDGHQVTLASAETAELQTAAAVVVVGTGAQAQRIRAAVPAATPVKLVDEKEPELARSVLHAVRAAAISVAPPGIGMCG